MCRFHRLGATDVVDNDTRTLASELQCFFTTQASTGAGDNGYLSFQINRF
jgi:hypothetical protein